MRDRVGVLRLGCLNLTDVLGRYGIDLISFVDACVMVD